MKFDDYTEEMKAEVLKKAKECKTPEELVALAKNEGIDLTDAQLDAISGGDSWYTLCPQKNCYDYGCDNYMGL